MPELLSTDHGHPVRPLLPAQRRVRHPGRASAEPPSFIEPCDPTLREHAPAGPDWVYEIKADGYRAQVHLSNKVSVYSRTGLDWTKQFAAIADAAASLRTSACVLDGEAVVYGSTGLPDFQALRREFSRGPHVRLRYHAFDLLHLDGFDLRPTLYLARKRLLRALLEGASPVFVYVDFLAEENGRRAFEHACRMGLEGLVAKRRDSPYRSGRVESWVKLKCVKSDTFPIVAFVEKLGAQPRRIASLYLGRHEGDRILYAGKAQSGYTEAVAREIRERLNPFITSRSPLSVP